MTFDKVKEIIEETLNTSKEITMETRLTEDLEADSLDAVELNMAFEEAFDIEISDDDLFNFKTVSDVVNYIDQALQAK